MEQRGREAGSAAGGEEDLKEEADDWQLGGEAGPAHPQSSGRDRPIKGGPERRAPRVSGEVPNIFGVRTTAWLLVPPDFPIPSRAD